MLCWIPLDSAAPLASSVVISGNTEMCHHRAVNGHIKRLSTSLGRLNQAGARQVLERCPDVSILRIPPQSSNPPIPNPHLLITSPCFDTRSGHFYLVFPRQRKANAVNPHLFWVLMYSCQLSAAANLSCVDRKGDSVNTKCPTNSQ